MHHPLPCSAQRSIASIAGGLNAGLDSGALPSGLDNPRAGVPAHGSAHRAHAGLVFVAVVLSSFSLAQDAGPQPVLPQTLTWFSPPDNPALRASWVVGAEKQAGVYLLRVKLAAGGRIAPHRHPDERVSTVLAGTIYVGFGTVFDEKKVVAIPMGGVYVAPANAPHYVWARDGEAMYQESGIGPTGNLPAKP